MGNAVQFYIVKGWDFAGDNGSLSYPDFVTVDGDCRVPMGFDSVPLAFSYATQKLGMRDFEIAEMTNGEIESISIAHWTNLDRGISVDF